MIRIIPGTEGILRNDVFSKADWIAFGIIQLLKNRLKTEDECGIVSIGYIEGAINYERASVAAEKCREYRIKMRRRTSCAASQNVDKPAAS